MTILVVVVGVFILSFYTDVTDGWFGQSDTNQETAVDAQPREETDQEQAKETSNDNAPSRENPFNKKISQKDMTDKRFRDFLHKMSHQKVIAEDKWGFYEITDERISWLLEALDDEHVQRNLENWDTYHDILVRWKNDDFSRVDKDHNAIWELQGGTIGIATGILSEEEEEAYIENTQENSR